jgi:hypothetical protein
MESKELYNTIQSIFQPTEQPHFPDISRLLTPFGNVGDNEKPRFIYDGTEQIPFKERLTAYQEIFIHEFLIYSNIKN